MARPQATVIDLAFYRAGAAGLRLGAEFHHNGLAVRCAQIGRVPRGLAHAWDRERLSAETIGLLRADGTAIREHLITAVVPSRTRRSSSQTWPRGAGTNRKPSSPSTPR